MTAATRIVLLCPNPVGARMGGVGIRYTELARALGDAGLDVTILAPESEDARIAGVQLRDWRLDGVRSLRASLAAADAVLTPPAAPHVLREVRRCGARIAVDLYDPVPLEVLERHAAGAGALRSLHTTTATDELADALRSGDFFVCASERQRDLWIGALLVAGRVTPRAYDRDVTLRALIDVVAFGVPDAPPSPSTVDAIRERFPQIAANERIVLWNGGLWVWLDAPAAIAAVALLRDRGVPVRLVFMGASDAGGGGAALADARAAVARHELGDTVLFNDSWVRYDERSGWLQAADAAISTHRDHLETRFAFRTRLLDCLWAGVPAVVTSGDALAERIAAEDLGAVAAPGDVDGLAAGIERVLERGRDAYAPRLRAAARDYEWSRVIAPLRAFLAAEPGTSAGRSLPLAGTASRPVRRTARRLTRWVRVLRDG